jgi:hypothetical protein
MGGWVLSLLAAPSSIRVFHLFSISFSRVLILVLRFRRRRIGLIVLRIFHVQVTVIEPFTRPQGYFQVTSVTWDVEQTSRNYATAL